MFSVILGIATVVCAIGWFFSKVSFLTMMCFIDKKGYTLPTDAELKTCSRMAVERLFRGSSKNKR